MIIHDVEQGSPEWLALRLGKPTASEFDKIVTPREGRLSKSARKYAIACAAEALLQEPLGTLDFLENIRRGKELEPIAVRTYQATYEIETKAVGFITTDNRRIGASPDRLIVGHNAALEVKCPTSAIHLGYWLDGRDDAYTPQVQGQIYVAELDYGEFFSFNPRMPPVRLRTDRDDAYIRKLAAALDQFCDDLDEIMDRCRASGFFDEAKSIRTAYDRLGDEYEERFGSPQDRTVVQVSSFGGELEF